LKGKKRKGFSPIRMAIKKIYVLGSFTNRKAIANWIDFDDGVFNIKVHNLELWWNA
jgi:hypothetical protein